MSLINVISAIGNNNSIYPLLVRDCGIEVPTKVALTYKQNKENKDIAYLATRERLVDEYTTSAIWLGGIPLLEKINSSFIKNRGFNVGVSTNLLKDDKLQNIDLNIEKFKKLAPKEVKDLEAVKNNKLKYLKLLGAKVTSEALIPVALMGFVIPKVIFAWTASTQKKMKEMKKNSEKINVKNDDILELDQNNSTKNITFGSAVISNLANLSTVQKMFVTDGGYAVGRVLTARNNDAAVDVSFKMTGMMFLNFVFPKIFERVLDKSTGTMMNANLNLDIKIFDDMEFINSIKENKIDIPELKTKQELLEYIDKNPNSYLNKIMKKYGIVKFLGNGIRDPRAYVNLDNVGKFKDNIREIVQKAKDSGDVQKFMQRAKVIKGMNIITNVGVSSFLLAYALPKAQFAFRKMFLGKTFEPGIAEEG